jgi:phosphate-selective porin OprO/OprP
MQIAGAEPGSAGIDNAASSCSVTVPSGSSTAAQTLTCAVSAGTSLNAGYNTLSPTTASVHTDRFGLEGILAWNNFKVQGEYSDASYKARSQGATGLSGTDYLYASEMKADVKTWYAEALWLVTGEKYADSYKNGVFSSFKPKNEFDIDKGQWGAIELAFRAEGYDVDNATFTGAGGRIQGSTRGAEAGAKTYTAGVRWILNPNLILKANYALTNFDYAFAPIDVTSATAVVDKEKMMMFRTQYMF